MQVTLRSSELAIWVQNLMLKPYIFGLCKVHFMRPCLLTKRNCSLGFHIVHRPLKVSKMFLYITIESYVQMLSGVMFWYSRKLSSDASSNILARFITNFREHQRVIFERNFKGTNFYCEIPLTSSCLLTVIGSVVAK